MAHISVHYLDRGGKSKTVVVDAFRREEVFWIGARKAGMSKPEFARAIIQLDEEKIKKLK